MHVIDYPNIRGKECNVKQRAIQLPAYYAFGIPTMPNYNLGPLDGSNCDNLGLNSLPLAYWSYDKDSNDSKLIKFRDLSSINVLKWNWDFGDGSISDLQNPSHNFTYSGNYNVCLNVSNNDEQNVYCRSLEIGSSDSSAYLINLKINVYPNPIYGNLLIDFADNTTDNSYYELFNQHENKVKSGTLSKRINSIEVEDLTPGIYYLSIIIDNRAVRT